MKAVIAAARKPGKTLAIALELSTSAGATAESEEAEEPESEQLSLTAAPPMAVSAAVQRVAISAEEGKALALTLDDSPTAAPLKEALADKKIAKTIHDLKSATHVLREQRISIVGVQHDPLLYAYLLDPTYSTYGLPDVAFRKFNLKMGPSPAEAADITLRLADKLGAEVDNAGLRKVYEEIDLPLVPVLARMEDAGVKLDCDVLAEMSQRLEYDIDSQGARDLRQVRVRVQHQFAQATWRRALQQAESA